MHSSEKPKPARQEDEHVVCTVAALEAAPAVGLDWDGLLAGGQPPCLALGAERRNEPRKD